MCQDDSNDIVSGLDRRTEPNATRDDGSPRVATEHRETPSVVPLRPRKSSRPNPDPTDDDPGPAAA